jgi:Arc/MetJ-type ribon-helix-helix transcriptional regulator
MVDKTAEEKPSQQVNIRLPVEMIEVMDQIVDRDHYNGRGELIREALRAFLKDKAGEDEKPIVRESQKEAREIDRRPTKPVVMANRR